VGLGAADAAADQDGYWTLRTEETKEKSHQVWLQVAPGYAKMTVRRSVWNGADMSDEATFDIHTPSSAVAVGLRTLAVTDGQPTWYGGDLMEAEAAAAKYLELTGIGGAYPKDPALLSWRGPAHLRLQVFPCPARSHKVVEYTLLLPTDYRDGAHHVWVEPMGTEAITADVHLVEAVGKLFVNGHRAAAGHAIDMDADSAPVDVALRSPSGGAAVTGMLAAVEAGTHAYNRVRFEAAPKLSEAPRNARVVLVFDVSRSLGADDLGAAQEAAVDYLGHMPGARVEVVTFGRTAKRRYDRFVPAKQVAVDLAAAQLPQENGSQVDAALTLAEEILDGTRHPARIVVFTDALTRQAIDASNLRARLSGNALTHVVLPQAGGSMLARDDDHAWNELARSTKGLVWIAMARKGQGTEGIFEELARPMRLDHLAFASGSALSLDSCAGNLSSLDEGQSVVCSSVDGAPQSWVSVAGDLWTEPTNLRVEPDDGEGDRWAALVFGEDSHTSFSEEEMMLLATRGGAVSPVTSYLAIEPGVRPAFDGIDRGQLGGRANRLPQIRYATTGVSGNQPPFDPQDWLTQELASAWLQCTGGGIKAEVHLETTLAEIVDVSDVTGGAAAAASAVDCLREATWNLVLPDRFDQTHATFHVKI
jgi:hypothetical protein